MPRRFSASRSFAATLCSLALIAAPLPALADPPPWAPAHGYRAKHKQKHRHAEPAYVVPFGIGEGTCYREALGQVAGGAVGGALGSQIGKGDGRIAAIIGGTLVGVLVGGAIGRAMDETDQRCVGQVLEHAESDRPIVWTGQQTRYRITPVRTFQAQDGRYCREYTSEALIDGKQQQIYGAACRQPDGAWELVR